MLVLLISMKLLKLGKAHKQDEKKQRLLAMSLAAVFIFVMHLKNIQAMSNLLLSQYQWYKRMKH